MLDSAKSAEDVVSLIPAGTENERWECKSGMVVGESGFRAELAKQVSAFANSGGGNIVLGVKNDLTIDGCSTMQNRQPTFDYLSAMVNECVENHIVGFRILPFVSSDQKTIYVVEIPDSLGAPHQSRADLKYYRRIPGHSIPATHFYLELLRNSKRKCCVEIARTTIDSVFAAGERLQLSVCVYVRNLATWVADPVGVVIGSSDQNCNWRISKPFIEGIGTFYGTLNTRQSMTIPGNALFPGLEQPFNFDLAVNFSGFRDAQFRFDQLEFFAQAFSQDFSTDVRVINKHSYDEVSYGRVRDEIHKIRLRGPS
jgi:hypothetical protein